MAGVKRKHGDGGGSAGGRRSGAAPAPAGAAVGKKHKTASSAKRRVQNAYTEPSYGSSSRSAAPGVAKQRDSARASTGSGGVYGADGQEIDGLETDESIDSDEAFESGDEDKYAGFSFRGSKSHQRRLQQQQQRKTTAATQQAVPKKSALKKTAAAKTVSARLARNEISLAEDSDEGDLTNGALATSAAGRDAMLSDDDEEDDEQDGDNDEDEDSDEDDLDQASAGTASDFEDDDGNDLMDLSEMLGASKPVKLPEPKPAARRNSRSLLDLAEEIPYTRDGEAVESDSDDEQDDEQSEDNVSDDDEDVDEEGDNLSDGVSDEDDDDDISEDEDEDESELGSAEAASDDGQAALRKFVDSLEAQTKGVPPSVSTSAPAAKRVRRLDVNEGKAESEHAMSLSGGAKLKLSDLTGVAASSAEDGTRSQALSAPLAKPIQDRIDRSAAYDTVKEHITKWQPAVKRMREAEHIVFKQPPRPAATSNALAADVQARGALEKELFGMLSSAGMASEREIQRLEDFEMAKLTVEEVQARRAELAKMRDLLFRQERKAKRVAKIKSKSYRRVHRREREKLKAEMEADSLTNDEEAREEAARKREELRARERMDLRHKNTGKWAQRMLNRDGHGEGSRQAISEQLRRGEELTRKMRDGPIGLSDDSDGGADGIQEDDDANAEPLPDKGVFGMKFMRDADERERRERIAAAERLGEDDYDDEDSGAAAQASTIVADNIGRRKFGGAAKQAASTAAPATNPFAMPKRGKDKPLASKQGAAPQSKSAPIVVAKEPAEDSNPWLVPAPSKKEQKSHGKAKMAVQHLGNMKPKLQTGPTMKLKTDDARSSSKPLSSDGVAAEDDDEADAAATEMTAAAKKGPIALRQAELVAQAFAGDDVVAEFEAAKEAAVDEDAPKEVDTKLPGWGSWAGAGVKPKKRKSAADTAYDRRFVQQLPGVAAGKRKDAGLKHVILNEKRVKGAKPFLAAKVPFPFESKEQYERSLRMPLGPEWATRSTFQRAVMPRVVVDKGTVVHPMQRPFEED